MIVLQIADLGTIFSPIIPRLAGLRDRDIVPERILRYGITTPYLNPTLLVHLTRLGQIARVRKNVITLLYG